MPSLLQLQDLYQEALVREIVEKTKAAGLIWNFMGGTQFHATETQVMPDPEPSVQWDFYITKIQIANVTYKYTLDVKKNGVSYIAIESGLLLSTNRDSVVMELYEIVEILVLQLDQKLKETMRFVQQMSDARVGQTVGYEWRNV